MKIFSDNHTAARVLSFGVFEVHTVGGSKCLFVFFSCLVSHGSALEAQWIPRSLNGKADLLRRFIDEDDSPVNPYVSRVVEAHGVLARILTVSHPIIERSASVF